MAFLKKMFTRKNPSATPAVAPALNADQLKRLADEKRQLDSIIAVKNVLSSESDKSITAISNEVFARLKNSKTERSKEFTKLHDKLAAVDLGAAFHFLYTVKGKDGPAPVPIMRAAVVASAPAASAPAASAPAASAPAASAPAASAPAAAVPITPMQGTQHKLTRAFKGNARTGAPGVFGHLIGTAGSAYQSAIGRGGAHTRRNLRKHKSRTIPSVGRDTSTGIRASVTNKATRRR
jgi:hypothetical protein